MSRVYNFSAGPAVLPEEVLKEAAAEMLDYRGTGMSVMEMSHRSKAFEEIIGQAETDLRDLLQIPDNYRVLFLQGGASLQFSMVPMTKWFMHRQRMSFQFCLFWLYLCRPKRNAARKNVSSSYENAARNAAICL